jgi:hypothetical protein
VLSVYIWLKTHTHISIYQNLSCCTVHVRTFVQQEQTTTVVRGWGEHVIRCLFIHSFIRIALFSRKQNRKVSAARDQKSLLFSYRQGPTAAARVVMISSFGCVTGEKKKRKSAMVTRSETSSVWILRTIQFKNSQSLKSHFGFEKTDGRQRLSLSPPSLVNNDNVVGAAFFFSVSIIIIHQQQPTTSYIQHQYHHSSSSNIRQYR